MQRAILDQWLPILGIALLSSTFGYACGRISSIQFKNVERPIRVEEHAQNRKIPTVEITGIENGNLVGTMHGDGRLLVGDDYVIPDENGSFMIASDVLLKNILRIRVPDGMHFVASVRGKKYYPVDSAQGSNLSPKNRVYFATEEEAIKAGFQP